MANDVQIFENAEFGKVRTIVKDGEPYFVGRDVADILGYAKPENAIATHVDEEDKTSTLIQGTGSNYKSKAVIINESGLYSLILSSKLPAAKKFKRWVTSEVLPSIRKTGSYTAKHAKSDDAMQSKRLEVMERNARTRAANLLLKIAERTNIPEYKAVCNAKAAEMVVEKWAA